MDQNVPNPIGTAIPASIEVHRVEGREEVRINEEDQHVQSPGQDSNESDPYQELSQMVNTLSNLQAKFRRREARMTQPDPMLQDLKARAAELEAINEGMVSQLEQMRKKLEDAEERAREAQEREDTSRMEKEQMAILYECNTEALNRVNEENAKIRADREQMAIDTLKDQRIILGLKDNGAALELQKQTLAEEVEQLKATLARTEEVIRTPIQLNSNADLVNKIKQGMVTERKLEQTRKELENWKQKYEKFVPASVQDERDQLEAELDDALALITEKDHELERLEEYMEGASHIG
jgi:chromosome segregation ATPase